MATRSVAVQTEDSVCRSLSLWDWLTPATVSSTARSLHQWRSIQGSTRWSCRKHRTIFSTPSTSGRTLGDRRALTLRQRCWNR